MNNNWYFCLVLISSYFTILSMEQDPKQPHLEIIEEKVKKKEVVKPTAAQLEHKILSTIADHLPGLLETINSTIYAYALNHTALTTANKVCSTNELKNYLRDIEELKNKLLVTTNYYNAYLHTGDFFGFNTSKGGNLAMYRQSKLYLESYRNSLYINFLSQQTPKMHSYKQSPESQSTLELATLILPRVENLEKSQSNYVITKLITEDLLLSPVIKIHSYNA